MPQSYAVVGTALLFLTIFYLARTIHSVYFGPLSRFPGPKLAAATLGFEFYYDVILQGQYTWKIRELHEKYGPFPIYQPNPSDQADDRRPNHQNQPVRASY